jgi:CBS domain-containing protein
MQPEPSTPTGGSRRVQERAFFLSRCEPFKMLDHDHLERVAATVVERIAHRGETILVESGLPGKQLYVVREGTLEMLHKEVVVDIVAQGQVFGHPTLLTGLAPEFTVRVREDSILYCLPRDVAIDVLSRPEGVRFVAHSGRDHLIQAARTLRGLPDVRTRAVTSLVRSTPLFCDPNTTVRDAAKLMATDGLSALLVRSPAGLGIVTDVDFRDKVVAGTVSQDSPVSAVVTMPVKTVSADVTAPEATIAMMAAGVNHLPVVDAGGEVVGILSASSLMTLDARSPFALRRTILGARTVNDVVDASADLPRLFVDLADAHVDAPSLTRIITVLSDAITMSLLEIAAATYGPAPVDYAWLALGSSARSELTLASDQDNGLAYADSDDPATDEYFRLVAADVNEGLRRCGFALDPHGVVARSRLWRMSLSAWCAVFSDCLEGRDLTRLARATVSFDFRQVAGDLAVVAPLTDIIRQAPGHRQFLGGLEQLGTNIRVPLWGLRQKLMGNIDIKKSGLLPVQNLARFYAFARGITAPTTLERLLAVDETGGQDSELERTLREAYISMSELQLRHHADNIREGRPASNVIDTAALRPLTRIGLQEALKVVAAAQKRFPRLAALL